MKTIAIVPVEFVHQTWNKCGHMIEAAMEHCKGESNAEYLKVSVLKGIHQLMVFITDGEIVGAVQFYFNNTPNDRVFFINAIGGKTCQEHTNLMFEWAKQNGATTVRGCARESVARLWRQKYKFENIYIMVEKRL